MISVDNIKSRINDAEKTLMVCFDMLLDFRKGKGDLENVILNFQPTLAECLYDLMKTYQELQTEKRKLISNKSNYASSEFSAIMMENAKLSKVVKETIEIGKNLGDAYAWFFFRDNRGELEKHFKHKPNGLFVGGIGGKGELEFVKRFINIDGLYVLYHGITNILRIGDFSLYDFSRGVVGVGELKTTRKDNKLNISASISSKYNIQWTNQSGTSESFARDISDIQKSFPRITQQLKEHDFLLQKSTSNQGFDLFTAYDFEIINSLNQQNQAALNSDNSLLLVGAWSKYDSLFDKLFEEDCSDLPKEQLLDKAKSLMEPASQYNMVFVGELSTRVCILSIPILWWDIDDEICKNLYFKKMAIATSFNPAKFLQYFINDGFSVTKAKSLDDFQLYKTINGSIITIGNFGSMCYLITNNLMKTEGAYSVTKQVLNSINSGEVPPNSKIEMNIRLNNFGKSEPFGNTDK